MNQGKENKLPTGSRSRIEKYRKQQSSTRNKIMIPTAHQQKIRDKLRGVDINTPQSLHSSSSHNIWGDDNPTPSTINLFGLYETRFIKYPKQEEKINADEVVSNVRKLLGWNLKIKNNSKLPWFSYGSQEPNYYLKRAQVKMPTQLRRPSRISRVDDLSQQQLRQLGSPEILMRKLCR